jgi:hypothetical protein
MLGEEGGDVVDLTVDYNPAVVGRSVLRYFVVWDQTWSALAFNRRDGRRAGLFQLSGTTSLQIEKRLEYRFCFNFPKFTAMHDHERLGCQSVPKKISGGSCVISCFPHFLLSYLTEHTTATEAAAQGKYPLLPLPEGLSFSPARLAIFRRDNHNPDALLSDSHARRRRTARPGPVNECLRKGAAKDVPRNEGIPAES